MNGNFNDLPHNPTATVLSSNIVVGQTKVAVTNTAVQLPNNLITRSVVVTASAANSAPVYIGLIGVNTAAGNGTGYQLAAGQSVILYIGNTNLLYLNGTANDFVSFIGN